MPASIGRAMTFERDGETIAGLRTKNLTINNEPVDITTDDASGFRTLMEESAERQIDASVEGLLFDDDLIMQAVQGQALIATATATLPSGATVTGDFRLNNVEVGAEYNDAITISAELHSSGEFDWTAPPD